MCGEGLAGGRSVRGWLVLHPFLVYICTGICLVWASIISYTRRLEFRHTELMLHEVAIYMYLGRLTCTLRTELQTHVFLSR